ncbi:RNA methyltransferase [Flavilitoribacter nigricans DSM 23189 = NBRC 102662]|uniref:RNA methyltransferase n=1 Tax=Flavilitoribacter nigricans (strain ATCC 23147 / DSM 23189 / NBRC 102662 / NCIMB 1420 / SS-2) TaxID=1122177 RepID=A0A2D0N2D0_FLAN2|nr:RNA methyltransferase [Flavilitoribacter nigricans DSM 23189 = NBRC 102662]
MKTHRLLQLAIKTLAGLEPLLAGELKALGARDIEAGTRIVTCTGDPEVLYRVNFESRTALRVLVPIDSFRATHEKRLYNKIQQIDWSQYMQVDQTLAIDAVTNSQHFRHSKYAALKTKDAIVDQFRDKFGRRPNINVRNPDLRINIHISNDICNVSLDSSGDSLHKRGYRVDTVEAPLNEVLAAGMVMHTGWSGDRPLVDPMCGSGTILIEAAMIAANIPPQLPGRKFGFQNWADYDAKLWEAVKARALDQIRPIEVPILGYDKAFKAVKISHQNILAARLSGKIEVERKAFEKMDPPPPPGVLIMNPPYDERLAVEDVKAFYQSIGDRLKQAYAGYEAWIISSNLDAMKSIGLRASRRLTLFNGPLECKYMKFELYEGSRKR